VSNKIKVTVLYLINHFAVSYHFFFAFISSRQAIYSRAILAFRTGWVLYSINARLNKLNHLFSYLYECIHMVVTRSPTTKKDYNMYNKNTSRITIIPRKNDIDAWRRDNVFRTEKNMYKQNRLIKI